jgi:Secretion system C-terminal sorting domain
MMQRVITLFLICFSLIANSQNQNLSNGNVFDGEPYITVNPNNSQHIVVAWMGWKLSNIIVIKIRTSIDAGQTWSATTNIPHTVTGYQSADPSLSFDNNGNLFLCFIDYKPFPATGAVYVTKSTDGGLNWGTPAEVINVNSDGTQQPVDRPWMVIDNSGGVNDGNIYVTTMNPAIFGPVSSPYNPYFIRSTDGGASFEPWRYIDTLNWEAGNLIPQPMPTPCIAADGTFHAIYPSLFIFPLPTMANYYIASSSNAGNSFSYNTVLSLSINNSDTLSKKGYKIIADPSDANHLMFSYLEKTTNGDLDVFMTETMDAGINWSTPIRVNDDPVANNRIQDLVWLDFDNDGDVIITWRDRRNAPDSTYKVSSEIYGAVRWKDSTNFSPNFMITDSSISYNTVLENSGNDFMCVNMTNDSACVVWGDTRNGFLNIWFQKIDLSSGAVFIKDLANDVSTINVYPNPSKNTVHINFGDNDLNNAFYEIFDVLGNSLAKQHISNQKEEIDFSNYSSGNYLLKFTNFKGSKALKIIKE